MYNLQDQLHSIKLYIIWQIEKVTKLQNVIKQFALQGFLPLFFFHKGKLAVKKNLSSKLTLSEYRCKWEVFPLMGVYILIGVYATPLMRG